MVKVYIYSGKEIDLAFGFKVGLSLALIPKSKSRQQFIIEERAKSILGENPKVGEVFIVENRDHGLVGRVNVATKGQLDTLEVNPRFNERIQVHGEYMEELREYIGSKTDYNKIVVANSSIGKEVERDVRIVAGEDNVRSLVYVD